MWLRVKPIVSVPACIVAACEAEARRRFPLETGGAFMGRRRSADTFAVVEMIGPGPGAHHGRTSFQPDARWQWSEMARLFKASGGDMTFLGDWHSHPGSPRANLSGMDLAAIREILRDPRTGEDAILSAVVFGGPARWGWSVWRANLRGIGSAERRIQIGRASLKIS